jgi:hypothetical protein
VFIDVITFDYENTPGVESPRKAEDLRRDVLAAAIVEGWNVRYAHVNASDFEQLWLP